MSFLTDFLRRQHPKRRAVFTTTINLNDRYKRRPGNSGDKYDDNNRLTPNERYYFDSDETVLYEQIREFATNIIEKDLQKELEELVDIPIYSVKVNRTYDGSIVIVFSVLFNIYQFIAGIKDFFDSLRLIREITGRVVKDRLRNRYGNYFSVDTSITSPNMDNHYYDELHYLARRGKMPITPCPNCSGENRSFFYYLVVANILLLAALVLLVWKAVKTTYGW